MANLPELSTRVRQLHELRWKGLRKTHGFAGAHLKWHESPAMRRAAAPPRESLCPPPPIDIFARNGPLRTTFYGSNGEEVSWEEWKRQRPAVWAARESAPAVIDSIGVTQTVALAKERFTTIVGDYLLAWAETNGEADFTKVLEEIRFLLLSEVTSLWETDEWHRAWFDRACRPKVEETLTALIEAEDARALRLRIEHLENPHVSLKSLVRSRGNLSMAVSLEQRDQGISMGDRPAPGSQQSASAPVSASATNVTAPEAEPISLPTVAQNKTPRRSPDLETSQKRIALQCALAAELAAIKMWVKTFCDPEMLKREFPDFELWNYINETEIKELAGGEDFTPRAFAGNIALRTFGGTSPETLKKDRRKLRKATQTQTR